MLASVKMREINRKNEELISQRHRTICINRYLTQPEDVFTDRYLSFIPMQTFGRAEHSDGIFVRMTNSGLFYNWLPYGNYFLYYCLLSYPL